MDMDTASSTAIYADAIAGALASGTSDDPIVISVHVLHLPMAAAAAAAAAAVAAAIRRRPPPAGQPSRG